MAYHSLCMHPVPVHKKVLKERIQNGEILMGEDIVERELNRYKVDSASNTIQHETFTTYTRHIKLLDIRQKMLEDHERLGLIRDNSDAYFSQLSDNDIEQRS